MIFKMGSYISKFSVDYIEHGCSDLSWEETFAMMGYKSYSYEDYGHYLSDEEFVIFALRYGR